MGTILMSNLKLFMQKVQADLDVFRLVHNKSGLFKYFYFPDLRTVYFFRLSNYLHSCILCKPFSYLLTLLNDFIAGVWIGPSTDIKEGLLLGHSRGLVINSTAKIGRYCSIMQRVTIGGPNITIGDNVSIGAGASIISNIRGKGSLSIGDHVIIGAGAVVVKDIPDCSVVVGVPGKVIKKITPDQNWVEFRKSLNKNDCTIEN
jgi:serine acetyltransferase